MSTPPTSGFVKQRFASSDGTDYSDIFTDTYSGTDLVPETFAAPGTEFEFTVVGDEDLSLRTMKAGGGKRGGVIGARSDHVVFWLSHGRLEMHFADRSRVILPGNPYIASASEAYRFASEETRYNGIHIRDGFLRQVASEIGFSLPDGPLLFDQQDEAIARLAPLRSLIRELGPSISNERVLGKMREALNRRIAVVVLDTFPMRHRPGECPAPNRIRDAIVFIDEHAREDLTLAAIAAAASMGQRGLQQLFRRTLDTTPMAYLRDHRLDEIRRELLHGDLSASATRVGALAAEWGFRNPGRFAGYYRDRFGELPAATVRERSARADQRERSLV